MFRRRFVKEIKGRVFLDTNNNGFMDNSDKPLKDIGVTLFSAAAEERSGGGGAEIFVRRERALLHTKTNEAGEYRFLVREGAYEVSLDAGTLPSGTAAAGRFAEPGKSVKMDFPVRNIDQITLSRPVQMNISKRPANGLLMSSADKVRLARRLGTIDDRTEIEYLLKALFTTRKLPADFRSGIPIKSGTGYADDIRRYMERSDADPTIVEAARQALASSVPKLDKSYKSPSGYFNINYTLTGENSVAESAGTSSTIPAYIEQIGKAFDDARSHTCLTMGFRQPVLDEGRNACEVYVFDQKGRYGITYSSNIYNNGNNKARTASCIICIDNSYSAKKGFGMKREDCMRVTAAHEFFHAVQYAYNIESDNWWKEASATWNEDEVFTGVNDYLHYISDYLSAPYKSLDESSYSGVIFAKFLSENYGGSKMIRRIWELQSTEGRNSISAIDRAIRETYEGWDIGSVFNRFSACNINPAQYYKEGALWKTSASLQKTWSSYPVAVNYGRLNHLSSNYLSFKPGDSPAGSSIRFTVEGTNGARWGFKLQSRKHDDSLYSTTEVASGSTVNRAIITVKNFGELYDDICLIPANLENDRDGLQYTYTVSVLSL